MSHFSVQAMVLSIVNTPYGMDLLVSDSAAGHQKNLSISLSNKKANYHELEAILRDAMNNSSLVLLITALVCTPSKNSPNKYFTNIYLQSVSPILNNPLPNNPATTFYKDVVVPSVASSNEVSKGVKKVTLGPIIDDEIPF